MWDQERRGAYMREYMKRYQKENRDKWNSWARTSARKHRARRRAENAKWRKKRTPEQIKKANERCKVWRIENSSRFKAAQDAARYRLKVEVLREYGGKCECCGTSYYEFLSVDHINGDGATHRKELRGRNLYRWLKMNGWPKENFRLLCMNCNFALGKIGWCPHQGQAMFIVNGGGE